MDTIQLSDINQTIQTRNAYQNEADYVHYYGFIEETKQESKIKIMKIIIASLLTVTIFSLMANVILTAALLSKY